MMSWADKVKGGSIPSVSAPANTTTTATSSNSSAGAKTKSQNIVVEDFPALSSSKPEAQSAAPKPENGDESATVSKDPVAVVKRGLGDGDHRPEPSKQPKPEKASGAKDERRPSSSSSTGGHKDSSKPPPPPSSLSYQNRQNQQARSNNDGVRPRAGSNREDGDLAKTQYLKKLEEETKLYKQRFESSPPKTVFTQIVGDLFTADESFSFAHCISVDHAMGAGIALKFRNMYFKTKEDMDELRSQKQDIGGCSYRKRGQRFIFNLITKKVYYAKPLYSDLEKSLLKLRVLCEKESVKSLAMPEIGAGLDKLEWPVIANMINEVFAGSEIKLVVYQYPKKEQKDNSKSGSGASARPTGTGPRAPPTNRQPKPDSQRKQWK